MQHEQQCMAQLVSSKKVITISGWPTDTLSIDFTYPQHTSNDPSPQKHFPHTVLLFVPGNPGCVAWYENTLADILRKLNDVGYAARGVSYAGHGVGEEIVGRSDNNDRDRSISWTVDGQVEHKIDWMDTVILPEMKKLTMETTGWTQEQELPPMPKFIFVTHSIGAHLVQRMCILRPDILQHTSMILHLMPFFRFDPPQPKKTFLSTVSRSPDAAIKFIQTMSGLAASLPREWIDVYMSKIAGVDDEEGRKLAIDIATQPEMARNFMTLGLEEIREVPERHDDAAMRIIGKHCPTSILFCGGPDQWAPHFHIEDLQKLQREGKLPKNIRTCYMENIRHDYVVHPEMVQPIVNFCVDEILGYANKKHLERRGDVKLELSSKL